MVDVREPVLCGSRVGYHESPGRKVMDTVARTIRSIEIADAGAARAANAIEDRYNDTLEVVVARQA
jgi:hypothetical protein